jgi:hypothetical protein
VRIIITPPGHIINHLRVWRVEEGGRGNNQKSVLQQAKLTLVPAILCLFTPLLYPPSQQVTSLFHQCLSLEGVPADVGRLDQIHPRDYGGRAAGLCLRAFHFAVLLAPLLVSLFPACNYCWQFVLSPLVGFGGEKGGFDLGFGGYLKDVSFLFRDAFILLLYS